MALTLYWGLLLMNWLIIPDKPPTLDLLLLIRFMGLMPNALEAMLATLAMVPMLVIMLLFFMLASIEAAWMRTVSWGTFLKAS